MIAHFVTLSECCLCIGTLILIVVVFKQSNLTHFIDFLTYFCSFIFNDVLLIDISVLKKKKEKKGSCSLKVLK